MVIESVSGYINHIAGILISREGYEEIVVYRGEGKDYKESSCKPNIFRDKHLDNNPNFEKNLFDEMSANSISIGDTYLEKAISAQHDGFPSRLLDVSYNSLIALYFACTPHYNKPETEYDDQIGVVYVYFLDKLFCPVGNNINDNYNAIIEGNEETFINRAIFQKNHKLIDHIKTNKRIIAQQGAFILFQGSEASEIPKLKYERIEISHKAKKMIRKELKLFFGIYTGSVYPEASNLVKEMTQKSTLLNAAKFDLNSELELVILNLQNDIEFYINKIMKNCEDIKKCLKCVMEFEQIIYSYMLGFKDLNKNNMDNEAIVTEYVEKYNDLVKECLNRINKYINNGIEIFVDEILITNGEDLI